MRPPSTRGFPVTSNPTCGMFFLVESSAFSSIDSFLGPRARYFKSAGLTIAPSHRSIFLRVGVPMNRLGAHQKIPGYVMIYTILLTNITSAMIGHRRLLRVFDSAGIDQNTIVAEFGSRARRKRGNIFLESHARRENTLYGRNR